MVMLLLYCLIYAGAREYIAARIKRVGETMSLWHKAFALTTGMFVVGGMGSLLSTQGFNFAISGTSIALMACLVAIGMIWKISAIHVFRETDRSSCTMFEIGMLPALLIIESLTGMTIGSRAIGGMSLIAIVVASVFFFRIVSLHGRQHLIVDGICMVSYSFVAFLLLQNFTTAYSLQLLQAFAQLAIIRFFIKKNNEAPVTTVFRDIRLVQLALVSGIVQYCYFTALSYGNPSMVTATTLSAGLIIALITGWKFFGELYFSRKMTSAAIIIIGVFLMYLPLLTQVRIGGV